MSGPKSSKSPLEMVADIVGDTTTEAFEVMGSETRLAIMLALWQVIDPGPPPSDPALSFSDLRERVGIRHGQNFNYHLDRLEGQYVRKTDAGYVLTPRARRIVRTVLAGTLIDQSSFEGGPIDQECPRCGATVVMDYDDVLVGRCTGCEGADGDGTIWHTDEYPPAGLDGRTPREVHRSAELLRAHRLLSMREGVCPTCAGSVTGSLYVCPDHQAADGTACERCGLTHESQVHLSCDVCKYQTNAHPEWFATVIPAVRGFFHDHGIDILSREGGEPPSDAKGFEVLSAEPSRVRLQVDLDGDHLEVILDEEASVVDVTRSRA